MLYEAIGVTPCQSTLYCYVTEKNESLTNTRWTTRQCAKAETIGFIESTEG